jgi:hypothetical protein
MTRRAVLMGLSFFALPAAGAPGSFGSFAVEVPARGFEEHCVNLRSGESVRYRYRASAPVDFNIHFHRGKDVHYPVRATASRAEDATFTAPETDGYCLMWEHRGDGTVRIEGTVDPIRP